MAQPDQTPKPIAVNSLLPPELASPLLRVGVRTMDQLETLGVDGIQDDKGIDAMTASKIRTELGKRGVQLGCRQETVVPKSRNHRPKEPDNSLPPESGLTWHTGRRRSPKVTPDEPRRADAAGDATAPENKPPAQPLPTALAEKPAEQIVDTAETANDLGKQQPAPNDSPAPESTPSTVATPTRRWSISQHHDGRIGIKAVVTVPFAVRKATKSVAGATLPNPPPPKQAETSAAKSAVQPVVRKPTKPSAKAVAKTIQPAPDAPVLAQRLSLWLKSSVKYVRWPIRDAGFNLVLDLVDHTRQEVQTKSGISNRAIHNIALQLAADGLAFKGELAETTVIMSAQPPKPKPTTPRLPEPEKIDPAQQQPTTETLKEQAMQNQAEPTKTATGTSLDQFVDSWWTLRRLQKDYGINSMEALVAQLADLVSLRSDTRRVLERAVEAFQATRLSTEELLTPAPPEPETDVLEPPDNPDVSEDADLTAASADEPPPALPDESEIEPPPLPDSPERSESECSATTAIEETAGDTEEISDNIPGLDQPVFTLDISPIIAIAIAQAGFPTIESLTQHPRQRIMTNAILDEDQMENVDFALAKLALSYGNASDKHRSTQAPIDQTDSTTATNTGVTGASVADAVGTSVADFITVATQSGTPLEDTTITASFCSDGRRFKLTVTLTVEQPLLKGGN